jgi:murein DD-endopeptidase MepM/ murein hydrolase activator NlpD
VLVILLAGPSGAADGSTTTSLPPATTTTSTTTNPSTPPTTTSTVPKTPTNPDGERSALSPEQTVATPEQVAALTDGQRALLRQLQATKDALAVRRFALVGLARQVTAARDRLDAARVVEAKARARVDEITAQMQRLEAEIEDLAAAAYRNQTAGRALGALGSIDTTNASTLTRAQTYVRADASALHARVVTLTALERRLESERRTAESARAEAETGAAELEAHLAAQTQAFADAADAAAKAQAAVVRGLGSGAGLLAQVVDPHFGADDISAALAFVQAGQGDPDTLDGIFALPIAGAPLVSHFGIRIDPIGGGIGFHAGLDFAADARTPIHAAAPGVVIIAGDCGGYGNCVVIDHGSSLATIYAHQSLVISRVGYIVTAGEPIGLVGSTGISTGPHLHFEVRLHGSPIDPVPTLTT